MKECGECGSINLEFEECGTDEYGEYEDYVCNNCGQLTRFPVE